MPFDGNKWNTKKMFPYKEMLKLIAKTYPLETIERLKDDPNDTSKVNKLSIFYFRTDFFRKTNNFKF